MFRSLFKGAIEEGLVESKLKWPFLSPPPLPPSVCTLELMGHQLLSDAVLNGQFSEDGARALGTTLARVHAATHIITVGSQGLDDLRQQFP